MTRHQNQMDPFQVHTTVDCRQFELPRDLKKSSTYREFEFSKTLIKTVKIDTGDFEKLFSSFIFFLKSQLQHSVLSYQSAHRLTSFSCSVQGSEFRLRVY